jgi:hypothetical protein
MGRVITSNAAGIAAVLLGLTFVACSDDDNPGGAGGSGGGSANDGGQGASDAGTPGDSGAHPDGRDPIPDGGRTLPDGSVLPSGTKLASGILSIVGVTIDNYAVYVDEVAATLNVVELTGGTPISIGSASNRFAIQGPAVLTWSGADPVAPLSVWTAANGIRSISNASYASTSGVALSPNGTRILFFDDVDADRNAGNLSLANTDGTGKTLLAASVALRTASCPPMLAFGGNTAAAAAFCWAVSTPDGGPGEGGALTTHADDAGSADTAIDGSTQMNAVVQAYSGSSSGESWTAVTLATNMAPRVAIASTGAAVLTTGPAGLVVYPIAGGAGTTIDGEGGFGRFTRDGADVIYTTPSAALKRSPIESPAPVTLAPYGFAGIRAISPDENWLLGYSMIDTRQDLSDLYLTSASMPGAVTTLSMALTAGLFRSDGFTSDSTSAIYYTDIANGVGTLSFALVNGGNPVAWASNVWIHYAASANTVVFNDNYDEGTSSGDIRVANVGQSFSSVIVSLADADFYVAGTRDKVVYSWKYQQGDMAGLWVATIPSF